MIAQDVYNKANHLKIDAKATPIEKDLAGLVCALATHVNKLADEIAALKGKPNPPRG